MLYKFPVYRQWVDYSCGAAVFRMVVKFFTGQRISNAAAIDLLGCKPDGVTMTRLTRHLRDFGIRVYRNDVTQAAIDRGLAAGKAVILDDNHTYTDSHVYLVIGQTNRHYWVVDPVIGIPTRRLKRAVVQAAAWCFHVH